MSKVDLNDVKAGKYRLVARRWDEIKSKPGQPFDFTRHRKGDVLDLNIEDARRLTVAGAVVPEEQYQQLQQRAAAAQSEPVFDDAGLVALRETLGLPDGADQAAILAAIQEPAPAPAETAPASDKIEDIVKWVGGDSYRARAALAVEQAEKGDQARPQLVKALEEIVTAPGGGS